MLSAPSSSARRDITVKMVVPTSGSLESKRISISALQVLQAAGEGAHGEPALAQLPRRRQAALARGAQQEVLPSRPKLAGIRQQSGHGDVPSLSRTSRDLFGRADIDDLEPERRRIGQRGKGDLDAGILLLPNPQNVRAL